MIPAIAFVLGSVPVVWLSRRSLLRPASHGFPRFFAFEAILALVVLNARYWFVRPFGARQLVSWSLLFVSGVLVVWGVVLLRRLGEARPTPEGDSRFEWENTARIVTSGVYGCVRHPMYASLLFLAWGAFLKSVSVTTLALAVIATVALTATAKVEEAENLERFGEAYRAYMKRTYRFVPFVI